MDIISFALAKSKLTNAVSDYLDEHLTNPTDPPIDTSLAIEGAAADAKATGDSLSQLNADITAKNSASLLDTTSIGTVTTDAGITFAFDTEENKCVVSGTASSATFKNLVASASSIPSGFEAGKTYYVRFSGTNVRFRAFYYDSTANPTAILTTYTDGSFTIPSDAVGLAIRLYVSSGDTVGETVSYDVLTGWSNADLSSLIASLESRVSALEGA